MFPPRDVAKSPNTHQVPNKKVVVLHYFGLVQLNFYHLAMKFDIENYSSKDSKQTQSTPLVLTAGDHENGIINLSNTGFKITHKK